MDEAGTGRRVKLILCILLWSLGGLAGPMLYPVLPDIAELLGEAPSRVHLTVSLFFAGFAVSHLLLLPLVNRLSLIRLIAVSLILFAAASLVASVANAVETVITARFFQGLAYGVLPVSVRAWLCQKSSRRTASRDLSIVAGFVFLIPIATPLIGAALAERYGWSSVFWLQGIYAAAVLWPLLLLGKRDDLQRVDRPSERPPGSFKLHTLRQVMLERSSFTASAQMVLLYSLVMLLPFDIARVVPALSDQPLRYGSILVAASFAAIALGSFLAASLRSVFRVGLILTFALALGLTIFEWTATPSLLRFGLGTTLISVGLGLTVWSAMSRAMTATNDPSLSRSAILGFVQYGGTFTVVTLVSLLVPPLALSHFASAALILGLTLTLFAIKPSSVETDIEQEGSKARSGALHVSKP